MNISKELLTKFNQSNSLLVLSSFPSRSGEVAEENAVARYSYLLLKNFPKNKKIIVICEKRSKEDAPFELQDNVLVVPTYKKGSLSFVKSVINEVSIFSKVKDIMVQFEFSIFGGKIVIPAILAVLTSLRLSNKHITFMFHQVVRDLGSLSGHLGLQKKSAYLFILNSLMHYFYVTVGKLSDSIIVHDSDLKEKLNGIIPLSKISVIPHGAGDTSYLSPELRVEYRKKFKIKPNDLAILAYGYLSWYKGTDWIIETVGEIAKRHPERRIKLLLAGTQSPTLKGTRAYALYRRKLQRLLMRYKKIVIATGFIPENEVAGVFAATDICVFPYRTRMSASGALSVAWQYGKRLLVSKEFSINFAEEDTNKIMQNFDISVDRITFNLNKLSFQDSLFEILDKPGVGYKVSRASRSIAQGRSWTNMAILYNEVCSSKPLKKGNYNLSYA